MKIIKKILNNGPLLIVIAASLWAMDGVIRRSLYILPPIIIVFYEHLLGALILSPFFVKDIRREKIDKRSFLSISFVSLLSSLLGTLWFTTALLMTNYISFSVVFLLQKLQPLFALLFARIILKEKLSKKYLIWAGLALVSAYFITFPQGIVNFKTGDKTLMAALFAIGAAFAWGSSTAFSRYALLKNKDSFITGLRFMITTGIAFIAVFIMKEQTKLFAIDFTQLLRFALIALSTGMVGILIYYKGLKLTQVKVSAILELTFPFLAVLIDMVLYKSFLQPIQILAAVILLFSMYRISRLKKKNEI